MAEQEYDQIGIMGEDGLIELTHFRAFKRALSHLIGKKLRVRFSILEEKRTDAQNRYCWGVIVPCVRAWYKETYGENITKDEAYSWLRTGLLEEKPVIKVILGVETITMTGKRFSSMSKKEFAETTDIILKKLAEVGCYVPEPRQQNYWSDFADVKDE